MRITNCFPLSVHVCYISNPNLINTRNFYNCLILSYAQSFSHENCGLQLSERKQQKLNFTIWKPQWQKELLYMLREGHQIWAMAYQDFSHYWIEVESYVKSLVWSKMWGVTVLSIQWAYFLWQIDFDMFLVKLYKLCENVSKGKKPYVLKYLEERMCTSWTSNRYHQI